MSKDKTKEDFLKLKHSAGRVAHYLEHRALGEGKKSELDEDYFYDLMKKGVFTFFGIECNPENGEIIKDTQSPNNIKKYWDDIKASIEEQAEEEKETNK